MNLLPKALGTRPRLAVEIKPEGVVAARAEDAAAVLTAVSQAHFAPGSVAPGLRAGNVANRPAVVAAVKKALEAVTLRERETSVVIPDTAVRVLLLDFDALPPKPAEALPVVRFRLKKLLPFDAEDAVVSYQVMSTTKNLVRVLAVAIPKDVLHEYEWIVRDAGFEPGAVLPSTLASLSGLEEIDAPALIVNVGENAVTTAIVQGGVLLLHRTVDLAAEGVGEPTKLERPSIPVELLALPLVDADHSAGEWAMQEPLNGYGVIDDEHIRVDAEARAQRLEQEIQAQFAAELAAEGFIPTEEPMTVAAREVTQAVSVAVAYFEDTLQIEPGQMLSAGTMGAELLQDLLGESGWSSQGNTDALQVREMVDVANLGAGVGSSRSPRGWLAGVRGSVEKLMRISINLASKPFVELRPLFAKLRLAMAALALLAIGLGFGLRTLTQRAQIATAQMNDLKARTARFENERQRDEARMRQPQNRALLERSTYLNELFARKSFSWTAVMMDLERVLPGGVQVTSIEPRITKEGDVTIRLRVSGDRDQAVQLVRNLERSQRFLAPRLASETAQATDKSGAQSVNANSLEASLRLTGVEFDILSEYNPLPIVVKAAVRPETPTPEAGAPPKAPKVIHSRRPAAAAPKGAKR